MFILNSRLFVDYQGLPVIEVDHGGFMNPEKECNPDVDRVTSAEMICDPGNIAGS